MQNHAEVDFCVQNLFVGRHLVLNSVLFRRKCSAKD